MGVAGSLDPLGGGAPAPDADRVQAIRADIVDDAGACAGFAEFARAGLASLNDRALAETRTSDLGECAVLLGHVRDRVAALDPARLTPRKGLAGLFDSRGARLKAFRTAYGSAATAVGDASADIAGLGAAIARKGTALDVLWTESRDAIAALDVHIAAARAWLADRAAPDAVAVEEPHEPVEAQADAEAAHAVETVPDSASLAALPHPLETRLASLAAVRAVAIHRLPLLRAAQNADCRAPVLLKEVCDGIEAWRAEWKDALGLAGRKPRKVRPDPVRLSQAQAALADRIAAADRELTAARARRSELEGRATPPSRPEAVAA
jgi:hypothetical protein